MSRFNRSEPSNEKGEYLDRIYTGGFRAGVIFAEIRAKDPERAARLLDRLELLRERMKGAKPSTSLRHQLKRIEADYLHDDSTLENTIERAIEIFSEDRDGSAHGGRVRS